MAITELQKEGYAGSPSFRRQVAGCVREFTLYLNNQHPDLDDQRRRILQQVSNNPDAYNFPENVIADINWTLGYDAWAADAPAAKASIDGFVQALYGLMTGFYLPPVEPPP
jgi:hypothetical protein